jgi:hypothetical protein
MAIDVEKLIATISPEIYCDPSVRDEVKKIVKKEEELYYSIDLKIRPKHIKAMGVKHH